MKILLATDGSSGSNAAIEELIRRPWPDATVVTLVSVAHPFPNIPDPSFLGFAAHLESEKYQLKTARQALDEARSALSERAPHLALEERLEEGNPKKVIPDLARELAPDLVLMGAHGHGFVSDHFLGSVAHSTVLHAPCSVEVVRSQEPS